MLSRRHSGPLLIRRSLASLVVVSVFLMSLAVDACQTSRFFETFRCSEEPFFAASSMHFRSPAVRTFSSSRCEGDEFCKDATTSVMVPTPRLGFQRAPQLVIDATFAMKWSSLEYPGYTGAESPLPESPGLNPLSINLRI